MALAVPEAPQGLLNARVLNLLEDPSASGVEAHGCACASVGAHIGTAGGDGLVGGGEIPDSGEVSKVLTLDSLRVFVCEHRLRHGTFPLRCQMGWPRNRT